MRLQHGSQRPGVRGSRLHQAGRGGVRHHRQQDLQVVRDDLRLGERRLLPRRPGRIPGADLLRQRDDRVPLRGPRPGPGARVTAPRLPPIT